MPRTFSPACFPMSVSPTKEQWIRSVIISPEMKGVSTTLLWKFPNELYSIRAAPWFENSLDLPKTLANCINANFVVFCLPFK